MIELTHTITDIIDTHAHVYEPEFDADRDEVMLRAAEAGVGTLLLPAIDSESHGRLFDLCRRYPDRCFAMMGLHPTSVNDNPRWREELRIVEQMLKNPPCGRFYGVGEIGLDYYWSRDFVGEQREAFTRQIELALDAGLPIAVHVRDAWQDSVEIIKSFAGRGLRGVFHAFSGTVEQMLELRRYGDFLFGVGGTVTFKKSSTAEVAAQIDLSEMVLETDCPYLTPAPFRGQRNEPSYIPYICRRIAEIKGVAEEKVAERTTAAARRIFFADNTNI